MRGKFKNSLQGPERRYIINGVTYLVSSTFASTEKSLPDALKHYLQSDFADLSSLNPDDKMGSEYVCPAAEEGGNHAAEAKN